MTVSVPGWKTACFWDAVTIRIPEQWQCIREPDGIWGCYEIDNDTGTVWVDFDVYRSDGASSARSDEWQSLEEALLSGEATGRSHAMRIDENYIIVNIVKEQFDPEAGESLHFSHWHHIGKVEINCLVIVHLTVVFSPIMLAGRAGSILAQEIEKSLAEARIDWQNLSSAGNA